MESWDLKTVDVEPRQPRILSSADDARTILLNLPEGEEMQEHEVHERARVSSSKAMSMWRRTATLPAPAPGTSSNSRRVSGGRSLLARMHGC